MALLPNFSNSSDTSRFETTGLLEELPESFESTASYKEGWTTSEIILETMPYIPSDYKTTALPPVATSLVPDSFIASASNTVLAYVLLFCIGAPGNLFVFVSVGRDLWRRQGNRTRIKVLIWHLATADLFVTFVVIPIEIIWRITIQWYGGNALCKLAQFFRAFGLYLSSMVIICISLDRCFAIVFPLRVVGGMKRIRRMLAVAWSLSVLFAVPQVST